MHTFPKVELPATELTAKELTELKNTVAALAAAGNWKPAQDKGLAVKTSLGTTILNAVSPGSAMVGADPTALMVRHTAFAAYAPSYILRLIEEIERLKSKP